MPTDGGSAKERERGRILGKGRTRSYREIDWASWNTDMA